MSRKQAEKLWTKYQDGKSNPEERAIVETWLANHIEYNDNVPDEGNMTRAQEKILAGLPIKVQSSNLCIKANWPFRIISIAAALIILLGVGMLIFSSDEHEVRETYTNDADPATNQATLTLSDSRVFKLGEINNGQVAIDQGTIISKSQNGQLIYKSGTHRTHMSTKLNTLSTPRGGQYQIILPDKSRVWLNAGSTLQFPSSFNGLTERRVFLSGEAYFEVTQVKSDARSHKHSGMPFIVKTAGQELMVLGTHFNINSYADEPSTKTTLLEGLVCIFIPSLSNTKTILKPGDQGVNDGSEIKVKKVVVDESVAWKNGDFLFNNESLEFVMRVISRWYDVDIKFEDESLKTIRMGLISSKTTKLSDLLGTIETLGDVHFKVKGKQVMVMK